MKKYFLYLLLSISITLNAQVDKVILFDWLNDSQSAAFDPNSLTPDLWLDGTLQSRYTSTVDFQGRIIDVLTTADANARTSTSLSSGNIRFKPSWNGEAIYMNNQTGLTIGSASTLKYYHGGGAFTIYTIIKPLDVASSSTQQYIWRTGTNSATNASQIGINLFYRNLTGTAVKTCRLAIFNAGGGSTGPFDVTCSDNSLVVNEYNIIKAVFTGTALTVYVYNSNTGGVFVQKGTDATGSGLSSSDATQGFRLGDISSAFQGYFKNTLLFPRVLNGTETTNLETYLIAEMANQVTVTDANVYFHFGQSNTWGQDVYASLPPDIQVGNDLGGHIFWPTTGTPANKIGYWDKVIMGSTTNPGASQFGPLIRYMKTLSAQGADPWLIIKGVGSTIMIPNGSTSSWTSIFASQINTNDLYPTYIDQNVLTGLEELIHVYRKNPIPRGLIKTQGESDGSTNVADTQTKYTLEWDTWITNFSAAVRAANTTILTPNAISTTKMRVLDCRIGSVATDGWPAVRAAEVDVITNYFTNHPSETSNIKAVSWADTDALPYTPPHYINGYAGTTNSLGQIIGDYFKLYYNEN